MAKLTNITTLKVKSGADAEFSKLVDITSYPDLGGSPETIDVTTLSDLIQRNILGIQSVDSYQFGAWYEKDTYTKIKTLEDKGDMITFHLEFGKEGTDGIFEWQGHISVFAGSGESNAARPMTITTSDEGEEAIHQVTA